MTDLKESYQKQMDWLFRQYENAVIDGDEAAADALEKRIEIFKKVLNNLLMN